MMAQRSKALHKTSQVIGAAHRNILSIQDIAHTQALKNRPPFHLYSVLLQIITQYIVLSDDFNPDQVNRKR